MIHFLFSCEIHLDWFTQISYNIYAARVKTETNVVTHTVSSRMRTIQRFSSTQSLTVVESKYAHFYAISTYFGRYGKSIHRFPWHKICPNPVAQGIWQYSVLTGYQHIHARKNCNTNKIRLNFSVTYRWIIVSNYLTKCQSFWFW